VLTDHEISAEDNVENACHDEFNTLSSVDDKRSISLSKANLGNPHVGLSDSDHNPILIRLIETLDKDLSRVATNPGHSDHGENSPVTSMKHSVWKTNEKHALEKRKSI
jgi:hypothetical protein